MLFILKNLAINEDLLFKDYNRFTQFSFVVFKYLIIIINNEALKKIKEE